MCQEMDHIYKERIEEGIEKGREEGKMEAKKENAILLAEFGMPVEQIAQVVKEKVSIVQKWIAGGMALAK